MNPNIEKLLSMLSMELIKLREQGSLKDQHEVKLEIDRFIQTDYQRLVDTVNDSYIDALNGEESGQINGYLVEYRPTGRFALDSEKLKSYFQDLGINEDQMKNLVYSHKECKPSLKFKAIKG